MTFVETDFSSPFLRRREDEPVFAWMQRGLGEVLTRFIGSVHDQDSARQIAQAAWPYVRALNESGELPAALRPLVRSPAPGRIDFNLEDEDGNLVAVDEKRFAVQGVRPDGSVAWEAPLPG